MRRLLALLTMVGAAMLLLEVSPGTAKGDPSPAAQASADQNLAIIVNQTNTIDDITLKELRTVFLGERSHWPNGRRITLVMMDPGVPERKAILRDICRMNETEFSRHFLQGLFTGGIGEITPIGRVKHLPGYVHQNPEPILGPPLFQHALQIAALGPDPRDQKDRVRDQLPQVGQVLGLGRADHQPHLGLFALSPTHRGLGHPFIKLLAPLEGLGLEIGGGRVGG